MTSNLRAERTQQANERKREKAKVEKIRQRNLDFSLIFAGIGQLEHREIFEEIRDNYQPIGEAITANTFREAAALLLSLADDWNPPPPTCHACGQITSALIARDTEEGAT